MRQEMLYYPHFAEKEPNMNRECQSQDLNQHFRALEPPYWLLSWIATPKMVAASAFPGGTFQCRWFQQPQWEPTREKQTDWVALGKAKTNWEAHILLRVFQAGFQCMEISDVLSNWVSNTLLGEKLWSLIGNQPRERMLRLHPWERQSSLGMWEDKYMLQRSACAVAHRAMWTRSRPLTGTSISMVTNMKGQPNLHMLFREFLSFRENPLCGIMKTIFCISMLIYNIQTPA